MDKYSIEAAQGLTATSAEIMVPHYRDLRERLSGALSASHLALKDMHHEAEQNEANWEMINRFVSCLPRATYKDAEHRRGAHFQADDVYAVRAIQSSTLWKADFEGHNDPYYVIGAHQVEGRQGRRHVELLLQPATVNADEQLTIMTVSKKDYLRWREAANRSMHLDYSAEEKEQLFNAKTKTLEITDSSPGTGGIGTFPDYIKYPGGGVKYSYKRQKLAPHQVSDGVLRSFEVFDRLIDLAAKFDKDSELQEVLALRSDKTGLTPTEAIIESYTPQELPSQA